MHFRLILSLKPLTVDVAIVISIENKNILRQFNTKFNVIFKSYPTVTHVNTFFHFFRTDFITFAVNHMVGTNGL